MLPPRTNSISRRLLRQVALLSLSLALALAAIQAALSYRDEIDSARRTLKLIETTQVPGISESLWDFNNETLAAQLEGILHYRRITFAAVYADGRRIESAGITIFPAAQPETNTFRARIDLPKGVQGLAPGMFVKVGLIVGESERMLVPRAAVIQRSEMRGVYVVGPDGRVSLRQVRLGRARGEQVEVLAGLADGERVALDPVAAGLRARQPATSHGD